MRIPDLPKSTVCFFNSLENKMTGGETASFAATFYLDISELFVKVEDSGEVSSPANNEH